MSQVKFRCGHSSKQFNIEFIPVTMKARVSLMNGSNNYRLDIMDVNPSFSEDTLRSFLLNKEKIKEFSEFVMVACLECNERYKLNEIEISETCYFCGGDSNITFCPHFKTTLCTSCQANRCAKCNPNKPVIKNRRRNTINE